MIVATMPMSGGEVEKKIPARFGINRPRKMACIMKLAVPSTRSEDGFLAEGRKPHPANVHAVEDFAARISSGWIVITAVGGVNANFVTASHQLKRDIRDVLPDAGGVGNEHLAENYQGVAGFLFGIGAARWKWKSERRLSLSLGSGRGLARGFCSTSFTV